jgi:outer membrane receptor protein involved in Fe transport
LKAQTAANEPAEKQPELPVHYESIVIRAKVVEPSVDRKDGEVFRQTLFTRDDHIFHLLGAGINAGQHEGGGKSVEVRRFGFNLDHGGVNGGLKVLVDNVQQNQSTQGHGQGYLGSLKSISPELVQEVDMVNGPFSAEYGDFSGLGVVHIRLRESMPDEWTARFQGGSYNTARGLLAWSPVSTGKDILFAYEGSHSDGPFIRPLDYRRDNFTANYGWLRGTRDRFAIRANGGRNRFDSSGQPPLDEIAAGRMDRYGFIDPGDGGKSWNGTVAGYFRREFEDSAVLRADAFVARSMLDLFSNFTFYLADPVNGDGIQQHDSRLQQGANVQYARPQRWGAMQGMMTAGGNFHANQIMVGMYSRVNRVPTVTNTKAHANVSNGAGYLQQNFNLLNGRLQLGGGLRYDLFRFDLQDRISPEESASDWSGEFQPKLNLGFRPSIRVPVTLYVNYGRGISSLDARGVAREPSGPHVSYTDFWQTGFSTAWSRWSFAGDLFWIDRSNELVYIPDDGSLEFKGPSRSYGFEAKTAVALTRYVSINAGLTKVGNAYYRDTFPRVYVDSAPHLVANAAVTVSSWSGWSGSLRMRAINHYRLDGEDPSILAAGHTVFDFNVARRITRQVDLNFAIDNVLDREYYEMQNYFESRLQGQDPRYRIHGTPGYGRTLLAGLTVRFGGK